MKRAFSIGLVLAIALVLGVQGTAGAGQIAGATTTAEYFFSQNTKDSSGNNYNGTVAGTSTYAAGPGGRSAFSFNGGTNIATTTANNLGIVGQSFTVDAWVNFADPTAGDRVVLGTLPGGTNLGLQLQERSDAAMMGFYGNDTYSSAPALTASTWYNIAWVYNATAQTQTIYVDGAVATGGLGTGKSAFAGTGETTYIGSSCCGGNMNGLVSNLFVWNSALTQSQILLASAEVPEPSSVLLSGIGAAGLFVAARRRRRKA